MRVLVLSTSFPDSPEDPAGGFVEELSSALRPHGIDSTVVPLRHSSGALRTLTEGGALARAALAAQLGRWSLAAAAQVAQARPQLVLAHWVHPSAWLGRLAAPSVPLVGVAHGGDGRLARALPHRLRPRLNGLIAVAPWLARELTHPSDHDLPTLVTPMGVWPLAAQRAPRQVEPGAPLRAVFVGRDVPGKGLALLRQAIDGLPHVTLTVLGPPPPPGPPEARVRYLGPRPPSGVWEALCDADVLCVPSTVVEGAPRIIAEAAACGVPVLASAAGGIPSVVPAPALVVPNTVDGWRQALGGAHAGALLVPNLWPEVAKRVADFLRCVAAG